MSGVIPDSVVSLRLENGADPISFRFPTRVKITGIGFVIDGSYAAPDEEWAVGVAKYRLAQNWPTDPNNPSVDLFLGTDNPICIYNQRGSMSTVAAPTEKGAWSDEVVRDIAQVDPDEWLTLQLYRYMPSASGQSATCTVSIAYTGATNLD